MLAFSTLYFCDNDTYFLNIVNDKIIINKGYESLLIIDKELEILKELKIDKFFSIYTSYTLENGILCFCPEEELLLYIDVERYTYKIISLDKYSTVVFSNFFKYRDKNVILYTYKGEPYFVELDKAKIDNMEDVVINIDMTKIISVFWKEKKMLIRENDTELKFVGYIDQKEILSKFQEEYYHDFDIVGDMIVKINEHISVISKDGKKKNISHKKVIFI